MTTFLGHMFAVNFIAFHSFLEFMFENSISIMSLWRFLVSLNNLLSSFCTIFTHFVIISESCLFSNYAVFVFGYIGFVVWVNHNLFFVQHTVHTVIKVVGDCVCGHINFSIMKNVPIRTQGAAFGGLYSSLCPHSYSLHLGFATFQHSFVFWIR